MDFRFYTHKIRKSTKSGKRLISGYASTAAKDRQNEVISLEALKNAANDLLENSTVFMNHAHERLPVGKVVRCHTDERGLKVTVEVTQAKFADDIWTLIKEGILNSFSIGGIVKAQHDEKDKDGNIYGIIDDMELLEVSIVGLPANPEARFELAKSLGKSVDELSVPLLSEIKCIDDCLSKAIKEKGGDTVTKESKVEKDLTTGSLKPTEELKEAIEKEDKNIEVEDVKEDTNSIEKADVKKENEPTAEKSKGAEDIETKEPEENIVKEVIEDSNNKEEGVTEKSPKSEEKIVIKVDTSSVSADSTAYTDETYTGALDATTNEPGVKEEPIEKTTEKLEVAKELEDNKGNDIIDVMVDKNKHFPIEKTEEKKEKDLEKQNEQIIELLTQVLAKLDILSTPKKEEKEVKPEEKSDEIKEYETLEKVDISKPYPNEHAARIESPDKFKEDSFRSKPVTEGVRIIIGRYKEDDGKTHVQAYRLHIDYFTAEEAKTWLKEHDVAYITFEPATGEKKEEVKEEKKEKEVKPEEKPKIEEKKEEKKPERKSLRVLRSPYGSENQENKENKPATTEKGWSNAIFK